MSRSNPRIVLAEMYESAIRATSYIEGMSKADFLDDTRTQEAVAMNLIVIGDGATWWGCEIGSPMATGISI